MLLLAIACAPANEAPVYIEPSFLEITVDPQYAIGSEDAPLAFPTSTVSVPVTVRTLDKNQAPYSFDGDITFNARPGGVVGDPLVTMTGGEWTGTVQIEHGFGPTRIWASDLGDRDVESPRVTSYATGVTDAIWYDIPTIAEMQATDDPAVNALVGEYAEVQAENRQVVVTAVTTNGFWVTDVLDEPGSGNSLYIYTFSKPDEAFYVGAQVVKLAGIDQEYLETTQFYWPTIEAGTDTLPVPDAIVLDEGTACDPEKAELLESSRVEAIGAQIPEDFTDSSDDYDNFLSYGQWPLMVGTCKVYVSSSGTVPDFYPPDHAGETLPRVSGMDTDIFGDVIITVLDASDLEYAAGPQAHERRTVAPHAHAPASRTDWMR
jgi:hypothetical protein